MRSRLTREEKRFLQRARVCRIGSVDRGGVTHAAPLCHAFDPETRTAYVATDGVAARNLALDDFRGGPELDRARRLLQGKFKQYQGVEIDRVIALKIESVTSWGL